MKSKTLQYRVSAHEAARIKAAADALGVSVSMYVSDAVMARVTQPCPECGGTGRVLRRE